MMGKRAEALADKQPRERSPWEYPDCPECGVEIYVGLSRRDDRAFHCHKCGGDFGDV